MILVVVVISVSFILFDVRGVVITDYMATPPAAITSRERN